MVEIDELRQRLARIGSKRPFKPTDTTGRRQPYGILPGVRGVKIHPDLPPIPMKTPSELTNETVARRMHERDPDITTLLGPDDKVFQQTTDEVMQTPNRPDTLDPPLAMYSTRENAKRWAKLRQRLGARRYNKHLRRRLKNQSGPSNYLKSYPDGTHRFHGRPSSTIKNLNTTSDLQRKTTKKVLEKDPLYDRLHHGHPPLGPIKVEGDDEKRIRSQFITEENAKKYSKLRQRLAGIVDKIKKDTNKELEHSKRMRDLLEYTPKQPMNTKETMAEHGYLEHGEKIRPDKETMELEKRFDVDDIDAERTKRIDQYLDYTNTLTNEELSAQMSHEDFQAYQDFILDGKPLPPNFLKKKKTNIKSSKLRQRIAGIGTKDFDKDEKTLDAFDKFFSGGDGSNPDRDPSKFKLPNYSEEDYEAFNDYVQDSAFHVEDMMDAGIAEDIALSKEANALWKDKPEGVRQKLRPYYQKHLSRELSWQKNPDNYTSGKLPLEDQTYINPGFYKNLKYDGVSLEPQQVFDKNTFDYTNPEHRKQLLKQHEYLQINKKDIVPKTTRAFHDPGKYSKLRQRLAMIPGTWANEPQSHISVPNDEVFPEASKWTEKQKLRHVDASGPIKTKRNKLKGYDAIGADEAIHDYFDLNPQGEKLTSDYKKLEGVGKKGLRKIPARRVVHDPFPELAYGFDDVSGLTPEGSPYRTRSSERFAPDPESGSTEEIGSFLGVEPKLSFDESRKQHPRPMNVLYRSVAERHAKLKQRLSRFEQ